ncbi:hypothetical protein [Domibacillus aminovorans]|uniref:Uncharacterized protein n=1 Tax=Domibacillus aminovorans TaxID=29332 RepID=A0A177L2I6_9BACI|nr:hypothetical protein [Domibacillus aminovorans]OAH58981.1 hypothetical protein AWH49_04775 [Domibacillus aminovorans]
MIIANARGNESKRVSFIQKLLVKWHKDQYVKYRYLEAGCMNEEVKTGLRTRKMYHYKKSKNML